MQSICQIIDNAPDYVAVPETMRHRRVELIFRPLDEPIEAGSNDTRGWPVNFFEQFSGCLANDPLSRPEQGEFEQRLELQ